MSFLSHVMKSLDCASQIVKCRRNSGYTDLELTVFILHDSCSIWGHLSASGARRPTGTASKRAVCTVDIVRAH